MQSAVRTPAVVCTEWPQFKQADWAKIIPAMHQPVFVDANRFLEKELKNLPGIEHLSVGPHKMKLKDINALITGGSQGLGKVIAEHFLREGANVVLCARSEKDLLATRDELARKFPTQKIFAKICDVSDESTGKRSR